MPLIHGFAAHAAGAELASFKYEAGELKPNEVEIDITHCGICRSDIHLIDNDWGVSEYPFIPGHEIVGKVAATGAAVLGLNQGDRVGVGWQCASCGYCEWCLRGEENLCAESQGTCVRRHGGYAEKIRVNARFVVLIPEALDSSRAAPLLCAGVTVYNPLRTHRINPASRVGVIGIGGLGHLAIQFANAFGAEVTAFSTSPVKEAEARSLGAHHFVNTRDSKALKNLAGTFDFILSTIHWDLDWKVYIGALRPQGTLCLVGVPPNAVAVPGVPLVNGQRLVTGSPIGSPQMIREMLDVCSRHNIQAMVESFPMSEANTAITKVRKNQIRYRAILQN